MSFKDGIPLLTPFDDEDQSDDDFTVTTLPLRRKKFSKKHLLFCFVLLAALFLIVALAVGVTVPVVLVLQDQQGGNTDGNEGVSKILSSSQSLLMSPSPSAATAGPSASAASAPSPSAATAGPSASAASAPSPSVVTAGPSVSAASAPSLQTMSPVLTPGSVVPTPSSFLPSPVSVPPSSGPPSSSPSVSPSSATPQTMALTPSSTTPQTMALTPSGTAPQSVMLSPSPSMSSSLSVVMTSAFSVTPSLTFVTPSATPTPPPLTNFYQSELDKREYKVMTLDNRLRVLLISDPNSNVSAASMDVAAGSFDDPEEWEGLAHFCEHMLFLGTEKYPEEGQYSQYLSQHGGYDNAFTSTQNTNFYFKVQAGYLQSALDMFAQFFISPLFTNSSVGREVNAVNAEHEKNLLSDGWRVWELLKNLSNPAHPFHKFSTGSLDTLMKPGLLEELNKYYYNKYSANRMQLVIYGRDNLTTLTEWTLYSFQNISDRNISAQFINTTSYPPPYNKRIIYYYPVANSNSLTIFWQVPSQEKKYRNAMSGFISRYLGQEDSGSVLHLLKKEGLVTSLSAGEEVGTETYSLLYVSVELTEEGLGRVSRVVAAVHWYVGLLRGLSVSDFNEKFREYKQIQQVVFDYGERQAPQDYVVSLAGKMRVVDDPEDFLSSPQLFLPDHTLFLSVLDCMCPSNAVLFLGTQRLNISSLVTNITGVPSQGKGQLNQSSVATPIPWPDQLDMYEDIYKTPYDVRNISDELADFWSNSSEGFDTLQLPQPNQFIVSKLDVLSKPDNASDVPVEVLNEKGFSLWWLLDSGDFPEPRVNFRCDITSAGAEPSPHREALTQLFTSAVKANINTELYSATEVGFTFDLTPFPRGISLSISGLSDDSNMTHIISTVSEKLLDGDIGELFDAAKQGALDDLANYNYTALPYRYTRYYIQRVVMERPYWKMWQVIDAMLNLSHTDVHSFANSQLLSNISIICFAHGNLDQESAQNYMTVLENTFAERMIGGRVTGQYARTRIQLPPGINYGVSLPTLNPDDQNSVVNVLFQVGSGCVLNNDSTPLCDKPSLVNSLHLSLLQQMIGSVCFDELRTQQQLGYVVFCLKTFQQGIGSFQVLVQSQSHNASDVYNRISNFLSDYYSSTLQHLDNRTWDAQVSVLRSTLQERDTTLGDRTDRFWEEIWSGRGQFTYRQQQVKALDESGEDFSSNSLKDFYSDHILSDALTRRLLIVVYAAVGEEYVLPGNYTGIDYSSLNQTATSFPVR